MMFGRTRRREAERFTNSVVTMRTEARSLEALLEVLSHRIQDSRTELTMISQHLMQLGDDATGKLGGITREFDTSTERLKRHGEALDRAAESRATTLLCCLGTFREPSNPRAPSRNSSARSAPNPLRKHPSLASRSRHSPSIRWEADQIVSDATDRLAVRLSEIQSAGLPPPRASAMLRQHFRDRSTLLLDRASTGLDEIRSGIDAQAAAVAALVEQASAGLGKAGTQAAESLATNIDRANTSIESLSNRVAEQDRSSQRMIAEIDRGLALIDERFAELAANGDVRANHFLNSLTRARSELDALATEANTQDDALGSLAERTDGLRASMNRLAGEIRDGVGTMLGEAQGGAERSLRAQVRSSRR